MKVLDCSVRIWGKEKAVYNLKLPHWRRISTALSLCSVVSYCVSLLYRFTRIVSYRPQRSQSLCANHLRCSAPPRPCVSPSCSPPPPLPLPLLSLSFSFTWAENVICTWMNKFLYVNILRQKRNGIVNILWGDGMSFSFLSSLFFFPLSHLWWC